MRSLFKLLLAFIMLNVVNLSTDAQVSLDVRNKSVGQYSHPVILPSMQNLIKLVDCDVATFKATMKNYDYYPKDGYAGKDYCYDNFHLTFWMYGNDGKGANTYTLAFVNDGMVCSCDIASKSIWPDGYIADWHRSMMPYHTKSEGNDEMYLYETSEAYYGFMLQYSRDYSLVKITVKKFPK